MGNYGNTVDRWYRRAAIVLWPQERDFIARAEADLPAAIAELDARLNNGEDREQARADARELVGLLGNGSTSLLPSLLPVADALDEAELAHELLARLSGEGLTAECAAALAAASERYGDAWTRRIVESWFSVGGYHHGLWGWVNGTLPSLAAALRRIGADSVVVHLCRRIWANLSVSITAGLVPGPQARAARMAPLVAPSAALFTTADAEQVVEFVAALAACGDGVLDLELPLLRSLGTNVSSSLVDDAVRRLEGLLTVPPRSADDWSIVWSGCGCELCGTLQDFLADRSVTELDWPLRTDRRQHIHQRIDAAEFPVTHRTIRKGSPYTLRLTKQRDLHAREAERRRQLMADLAWLRRESWSGES